MLTIFNSKSIDIKISIELTDNKNLFSRMFKEIIGSNFNKIYKNTKFYRFMNDNLTHYGFTYKIGLNKDVYPFNPSGECEIGGLYFCDESTCYLFCTHYGNKVAFIEIPDDARVYIEENKFKADKIIITDIVDFENMPDSLWINIAPKCGIMLKYVDPLSDLLTESICAAAVNHYGLALEFVPNKFKSINVCTLAVQQNGLSLQFVPPDLINKEICILATKQYGCALKYVPLQFRTVEMWKAAVQQEGNVLKFFERDLTDFPESTINDIRILAIKQNGMAMRFIKDVYQTEELCILAVTQNGRMLNYVKIQTEAICIAAVKQNGNVLQNVINQTEAICIEAVKQNGLALYYAKTQTPIMCILAVEQNPFALQFVKEQTLELCGSAIKQNPYALIYVKDEFKSLFV